MNLFGPEYFFDACTMIGKWHRRQLKFSSVESLLAKMSEFRIRKSLVLHSSSWLYDFRRGNKILDQEISDHSELIPCYAAIPFTTGEMPQPDHWDHVLRTRGAFVFRIFPSTHNFPLQRNQKLDFFAYSEEKRIPIFVDIDEINYRDLWSLCSDYPGLRLILGNSGTDCLSAIYREYRQIYEFFERFGNVAMETSFLIGFRGIEDVCTRYGAHRLVFGSRMPFLEPGSAIFRIQYAEIEAEAKEQIAHKNMERLLAEVAT